MKTASISESKQELLTLPPKKVLEICVRLAKFKKENKELLSFLLFDANDEHGYVQSVKLEIDEHFTELPRSNWFNTKKSLRKILRLISKYSKYVSAKEFEVEMRVHFCTRMKTLGGTFYYNQAFSKLYQQQLKKINVLVDLLHEDIRFDYKREINQL